MDHNIMEIQLNSKDDKQMDEEIEVEENVFQASHTLQESTHLVANL